MASIRAARRGGHPISNRIIKCRCGQWCVISADAAKKGLQPEAMVSDSQFCQLGGSCVKTKRGLCPMGHFQFEGVNRDR